MLAVRDLPHVALPGASRPSRRLLPGARFSPRKTWTAHASLSCSRSLARRRSSSIWAALCSRSSLSCSSLRTRSAARLPAARLRSCTVMMIVVMTAATVVTAKAIVPGRRVRRSARRARDRRRRRDRLLRGRDLGPSVRPAPPRPVKHLVVASGNWPGSPTAADQQQAVGPELAAFLERPPLTEARAAPASGPGSP